MTNAMYPSGKKALLDADIDLLVDTIKVALVTSAYNSAHDNYDDLTGVVGTDQTLGSKDTTAGVFDAADSTWNPLTGTAILAAVIYKDTGSAATSKLLCYIDTITGFPLTISGGSFTLVWDSGASKIFRLV